jgi:hypothetical protein
MPETNMVLTWNLLILASSSVCSSPAPGAGEVVSLTC